ncbi:MAG: hypothetical protein AAGN82_07420 [Myxococcota bacterium]
MKVPRLAGAAAGGWLLGAVAAMGPGCGSASDGEGGGEGICEPGANVFCRCPSGEPGTMACLDGNQFGECVVGFDQPCPVREGRGGGGASAGPSGTTGAGTEVCTPGEQVFCTCDGQTGLRVCADDGQSFEDCVCDAPTTGSGGSSSSSGTGGGGGLPLYSPCSSPNDCQSGVCEMGYCSQSCTTIFDCAFGVAECVRIDGSSFCRPICLEQLDCSPYQAPSECGYTAAVDDVPVTVCADWFNTLALPPINYFCTADVDCSLGHPRTERACNVNQNSCAVGCGQDLDCPIGEFCAFFGVPGTCTTSI